MPAKSAARRLSKSRYLAGLQCHKQLWWRVHEPDAPELVPDVAQQNLFDQGKEVGERARAYVPRGELIDLPYYQYDNKDAATRELLQRKPAAIYEAWFLGDETYAGVDILEHGPRGYGVIEVKATNRLKPEHIPDVAVEVHVLRRSGLRVDRAELMHLNPKYRYEARPAERPRADGDPPAPGERGAERHDGGRVLAHGRAAAVRVDASVSR